MTKIPKLGLCTMVVGALALFGARAQAQQAPPAPPAPPATPASMSPDSTSAKRGSALFVSKGCNTCHNIDHTGKMSGPDLRGVVQNREREWLKRFLKDTEGMLKNDPFAIAMLKKWDNVKMPTVALSDSEIEALINYLGEKQNAPAKD